MNRTKLSSKGQVVLPKEIREAHHWRTGTQFMIEELRDGVLLREFMAVKPTRLKEVIGCLRYRGKPKTLAQMDEAITAEVKARRDRGRY